MKKVLRKTKCLVLSILMAVSLVPMNTLAPNVHAVGSFDFTIVNSVLTKYNGTGGDVIVPNGVRSIGNNAFERSAVTSVSIPNCVINIGKMAFSFCSKLTKVDIPQSITKIGYCAFQNCSYLDNVIIPKSVISIEERTFENCVRLKNVVIPDSVQSIGDGAFYYCSLTNVNIPNGVTIIGQQTFEGCDMTTLVIPDSVKCLGFEAFENCTFLQNLTIGSCVTTIDNYAFKNCAGLTNLTIPSSVKRIGNSAFFACSNLSSINFEGDSIRIEESAFDSTPWLNNYPGDFIMAGSGTLVKYKGTASSLTIHDNVKSIGEKAFSGCTSLSSVTFENSNIYIGSLAFSDCSNLSSVSIPGSVEDIGYLAFSGTPWLENYPGSFVIIGNGILIKGKSGNIPSTVKTIGDSSFSGCTDLYMVTIPSGVTKISSNAFGSCSNLHIISIPPTVTDIADDAFMGTDWLENNHDTFVVMNGILLKCNSNTSNVTVPSDVTRIASSAFYLCYNITKLTLPDSLKSIGTDAFGFCNKLANVVLPSSVERIDSKAFHLSGIMNLTVTSCNTTFGDLVFKSCSDDLIITCPAGSNAETYANKNGINYILSPGIVAQSDINIVINSRQSMIYGLSEVAGMWNVVFDTVGGATYEVIPLIASVCGTGSKVKIIFNGEIVKTYEIIIFGDINGDGNIDSIDAGRIVDYQNYMTPWDIQTDAKLFKAADLNGDGNIDSIDAGIAVDVSNYQMTIDQTTGFASPIN